MGEIKGRDCWNAIFLMNVVVLGIAGMLFGWDKALYSIIFQFVSTQVIHTLHKRYQRHTLWIITEHPEEIYQMIAEVTNHDATLFKGVGCYKRQERQMLYSIVSSDELKLVCCVSALSTPRRSSISSAPKCSMVDSIINRPINHRTPHEKFRQPFQRLRVLEGRALSRVPQDTESPLKPGAPPRVSTKTNTQKDRSVSRAVFRHFFF